MGKRKKDTFWPHRYTRDGQSLSRSSAVGRLGYRVIATALLGTQTSVQHVRYRCIGMYTSCTYRALESSITNVAELSGAAGEEEKKTYPWRGMPCRQLIIAREARTSLTLAGRFLLLIPAMLPTCIHVYQLSDMPCQSPKQSNEMLMRDGDGSRSRAPSSIWCCFTDTDRS